MASPCEKRRRKLIALYNQPPKIGELVRVTKSGKMLRWKPSRTSQSFGIALESADKDGLCRVQVFTGGER